MKKVAMWAAVAVLAFGTVTVSAGIKTYRLTFSAADMLNNVYVDGDAGTTASDNDLYDGARLLRVGRNANHADAARTYVGEQHGTFSDRWNTYAGAGWTYESFNLWGLDGRGANWGDDFKAADWLSMTGPAGWEGLRYEWPDSWGDLPDGAITNAFPLWYADQDGAGLALNATLAELEAATFTVDIQVDEDDAWFNAPDAARAPNDWSVPELTLWFGGYIYSPDGTQSHLYEGNMVLNGDQIRIVPVPGAALLGALGIGLVARMKRRVA